MPAHKPRRILVVDLNNFARYPTLSVGILAAALRQAGHDVHVFSPLMVGVHGVTREQRPRPWSLTVSRWNHRIATSKSPHLRRWRNHTAAKRASGIRAQGSEVAAAAVATLDELRPDLVIASTYLMYRDVTERIAAAAKSRGIPLCLGGPYFAQPEVIESWARIAGVSALAAGEVELELADIVETLCQRGDPSQHRGLFCIAADGSLRGQIAAPLQQLDRVPFPDYSDFPWERYPNRIASLVTGRGCSWGACTFCSDVTSTAGRTYRSRSLDNVLAELRHQHQCNGTSQFVFADLKLNSNLSVWRGLAAGFQSAVPGGTWIGAVHVGPETDNGLSPADLRAAAKSGCVRLTTGLETGSERVAKAMHKGTDANRLSAFLQAASEAGISTRCTMVIGHPGEQADDVAASAKFLAKHRASIERVSLNRLNVITGTRLHRNLVDKPESMPGYAITSHDASQALVEHTAAQTAEGAHRRQVYRLLSEVHRINRKPLAERATAFEGVM
ncbi:MAG: radical SAM protein [Planctomycetota bacterium]